MHTCMCIARDWISVNIMAYRLLLMWILQFRTESSRSCMLQTAGLQMLNHLWQIKCTYLGDTHHSWCVNSLRSFSRVLSPRESTRSLIPILLQVDDAINSECCSCFDNLSAFPGCSWLKTCTRDLGWPYPYVATYTTFVCWFLSYRLMHMYNYWKLVYNCPHETGGRETSAKLPPCDMTKKKHK